MFLGLDDNLEKFVKLCSRLIFYLLFETKLLKEEIPPILTILLFGLNEAIFFKVLFTSNLGVFVWFCWFFKIYFEELIFRLNAKVDFDLISWWSYLNFTSFSAVYAIYLFNAVLVLFKGL